jgi:fibroblast growth factor receptor 2
LFLKFFSQNLDFPRSKLELGRSLGEGAFGKVVMASANGILNPNKLTTVAVKMLKENFTENDVKDLVDEIEVMKTIGHHENFINLLGCCLENGPLFVIVEYARHGNLKDFLTKHRPTNDGANERNKKILLQRDLVGYGYQVACGMEYLASRKYV